MLRDFWSYNCKYAGPVLKVGTLTLGITHPYATISSLRPGVH